MDNEDTKKGHENKDQCHNEEWQPEGNVTTSQNGEPEIHETDEDLLRRGKTRSPYANNVVYANLDWKAKEQLVKGFIEAGMSDEKAMAFMDAEEYKTLKAKLTAQDPVDKNGQIGNEPDTNGNILPSQEAAKNETDTQYDPNPNSGSSGRGLFSPKIVPLFMMISTILLLIMTIGMIIFLTRDKDKTDSWVYQAKVVEGIGFSSWYSNTFDIGDVIKEYDYSDWELCAAIPLTETVFPNLARGDTVIGIKSNTRTLSIVLIFKRKL